MNERDPFAVYRERMEAVGFRPSRHLGQNFLLQPELHRVIAEAAEIQPDDVVLEIGAGLGFLTRELASRARCVIAVEIDARLHELLQHELPCMPEGHRVRLLRTDILGRAGRLAEGVLAALADAGAGRALRVVANLPYAITGPVLASLCTSEFVPAAVAILIQREAAERLNALPGQKAWGSLSAVVQACYRVRVVRRVGREVFRPRPNVDSAITALTRLPLGLATLSEPERTSFAAFARALFAARRKKIRHRLAAAAAAGGLPPPDSAAAWPVLESRPDQLDVAALTELWRGLRGGS